MVRGDWRRASSAAEVDPGFTAVSGLWAGCGDGVEGADGGAGGCADGPGVRGPVTVCGPGPGPGGPEFLVVGFDALQLAGQGRGFDVGHQFRLEGHAARAASVSWQRREAG